MARDLGQRVQQRTGSGNSSEVARRENDGGGTTLAKQIRSMQAQYADAMPRGFEAQQLTRDALTLLRTTPHLAECTQDSVLGGLMTFAQLGLRPGVLGQGWLLPFRKRVKVGPGKNDWADQYQAQIVIGYQGFVELAYRSTTVNRIIGRAVHERDVFEIEYGLTDRLVHRPYRGEGGRGAATDYYCVIHMKDAEPIVWHMSRQEGIEWRNKFAMSRKINGTTGEVYGSGPWFEEDNGPPGASGLDQMILKGLALDTPIPTPSGWTTMGTVRVGDLVIDRHGQPVPVAVKSQVKHLDCYRVRFTNGEEIVCDAEHRWLARASQADAYAGPSKSGPRNRWPVYTIGQMYAAKQIGRQVTVPVAEPVDLPEAKLPLDPWVLGYWLGDGSAREPVVTCNVDNLDEVAAAIRSAGYVIGFVHRDKRSRAVSVRIKGIRKVMADLGVLGHKHVPDVYRRGSIRQRLALLRGLMDSDGGVDTRGRAYFGSTDQHLTDAVVELAGSLGEVVCRHQATTTGYGCTALSYRATWTPATMPVTLRAKADRVRPRRFAPYRVVASIERIDSVPTQCIGVDSPSHTFLAGQSFTPTHNTCYLRGKRWAPKSTDRMLTAADQVDGAVRMSYKPEAPDDFDEMLNADHPDPGDVVEGEVATAATPGDDGTAGGSGGGADTTGVNQGQKAGIAAVLGEGGVRDRADRLRVIGHILGTPPPTTMDLLTFAQGLQVLTELNRWQRAKTLRDDLAVILGGGAAGAPAGEQAGDDARAADTAPAADAGDTRPVRAGEKFSRPGTKIWHENRHPQVSDGQVTFADVAEPGDCGFCDPDPDDEPPADSADTDGGS